MLIISFFVLFVSVSVTSGDGRLSEEKLNAEDRL